MIVDGKWIFGAEEFIFILNGFDGQDLFEIVGKKLSKMDGFPIILRVPPIYNPGKFGRTREHYIENLLLDAGHKVLYMEDRLARIEMSEEYLLTHSHERVRIATAIYLGQREARHARI